MARSIPFIDSISQVDPARPALYCDKAARWISYGELAGQVASATQMFSRPDRRLAFLVFSNTRRDVAAYLGLLAAGHVVALIDPKLDADLLRRLFEHYRPEMVVGERATQPVSSWTLIPGSPTVAWERPDGRASSLHPDLCLLLTTSGSTGSPKMVRLSARALGHNTNAIRQTLAIDERTRAVAHLPLHYSYGLSILHTHLLAGASLVLTDKTMFEAEFWSLLRALDCTSLPGTPFHYRMMDRLGLDRLDVPTLSVLTQAGGRLEPKLVRAMHKVMVARGGRFYVMYGQTEAAPRMTTLSHDEILSHLVSVGRALKDATLSVVDARDAPVPPGIIGEVVYRGPNVMMGYAENRQDLARGDDLDGVLHTGDLGSLDKEGFLTLAGRANRFAKIAGLRINLDEVESLAAAVARVAAVERDGRIVLFAEQLKSAERLALRRALTRKLHVTASSLVVQAIDVLPVTAKGKVDYARLTEPA